MIKKAVQLPEPGMLFAGVCGNVIQAQDGVELIEIGIVVVVDDGVEDVADGMLETLFAVCNFLGSGDGLFLLISWLGADLRLE